MRATKVGADTALAQIVKLVQQAQNSKAPGQRLADRAAFWLVFVALLGGVGTFVTWLLASDRPFSAAMLFAITVVVVTCPDALGPGHPDRDHGRHRARRQARRPVQERRRDRDGRPHRRRRDGQDRHPDQRRTGSHRRHRRRHRRTPTCSDWRQRWKPNPNIPSLPRSFAAPNNNTCRSCEPKASRTCPGHGAIATVDGHRVVVGNRRLFEREQIDLGPLAGARDKLAASGRTAVLVAVDGKAAAVIGIADAVRDSSAAAVVALHELGVEVVMLTGDNQATADRIARELGIDTVIAEVLPGDKAAKIAELQAGGRKVAMVGDGVNDAPALAQADLGIAIGAGTDVAIDTADIVLMRSDPLDVATALRIGRGTLRKMRQNLGWAIGYNTIALPIAAGVFEPAFGLILRPEIAALSMAGSSLIVAVNALMLKRLRLPRPLPSGGKPGGSGLPG